MRRSRVKEPAEEEEARWGLEDMFVDRPGGDAGAIMAAVWGNSPAEYAEIVERDLATEQHNHPDRFVRKIGPRKGKKPPKDPCRT